MIRVAFRNIFRHKFKNLLIFIAFLISELTFLILSGFITSYKKQGEKLIKDAFLGDVCITVHNKKLFLLNMFFVQKEKLTNLNKFLGEIDFSKLYFVKRLSVVGFIFLENETFQVTIYGVNIEEEKDFLTDFHIIKGEGLKSNELSALIPVSMTNICNIGSNIIIFMKNKDGYFIPFEFKVVGIYENFLLKLNFEQQNIFVDMKNLQMLLGFEEKEYTDIYLKGNKLIIKKVIQIAKNNGLNIIHPFEKGRIAGFINYLSFINCIFQLFMFLILAVIIISSVYSSVIERKNEIGIMMAIGCKHNILKKIFIIEYEVLALLSIIFSIVIYYFLCFFTGKIPLNFLPQWTITFFGNEGIYISFNIFSSVGACLFILLFVILIILIPLKKIDEISIIDTMRKL